MQGRMDGWDEWGGRRNGCNHLFLLLQARRIHAAERLICWQGCDYFHPTVCIFYGWSCRGGSALKRNRCPLFIGDAGGGRVAGPPPPTESCGERTAHGAFLSSPPFKKWSRRAMTATSRSPFRATRLLMTRAFVRARIDENNAGSAYL